MKCCKESGNAVRCKCWILLICSVKGTDEVPYIWLDCILKKEIGKVVDWSKVDKKTICLRWSASDKGYEIKHILKGALTDEVDSREVYMKGIDHSYYYEGYMACKVEELKNKTGDKNTERG